MDLEKYANSKYTSHWAEDLVIGDKVYCTIRHNTNGERNIKNALLVVIENHSDKMKIKGLLSNFAGKALLIMDYNELSEIKCNCRGNETCSDCCR